MDMFIHISLDHMVILISQNKITDFFMTLAWACPFEVVVHYVERARLITEIEATWIQLKPGTYI